jgi:hypothetical protein
MTFSSGATVHAAEYVNVSGETKDPNGREIFAGSPVGLTHVLCRKVAGASHW